MPNETGPATTGGKREEIVHSGQYVQVVRMATGHLAARPRKVPYTDEGEYLINMINELKDAYEKITKDGGPETIYISAFVEHNNIMHTITIDESGDVRVKFVGIPVHIKRTRIIEWADNVELEAADGGEVIYHGQYVDVAEGEDGMLRAYPRRDVGLGPFKLMLAAIDEVQRKFRTLTKGRTNKAVEIRGLVWKKGVAHRPVIRGRDVLEFELARGDYVDLAKGAELIVFPVPEH